MTQAEFKREMRAGFEGVGFNRGTRVKVNPEACEKYFDKSPYLSGNTGTVVTKLIGGKDGVRNCVKFDNAVANDGRMYGSFPHTDLMAVIETNDKPTEIDLLGQRIRRT